MVSAWLCAEHLRRAATHFLFVTRPTVHLVFLSPVTVKRAMKHCSFMTRIFPMAEPIAENSLTTVRFNHLKTKNLPTVLRSRETQSPRISMTSLCLGLFRILDISLVGRLAFGVLIVKLVLVAYKLLHCSYTTTFRGFFENSSEKPFYIIEIIKDAVPKGVERRASRQNDHVLYYLREFT